MIYVASDHIGAQLKDALINRLSKLEYPVQDMGPSSGERVNYTDFAQRLCEKVLRDPSSQGILICGTGIGMSMMANRYNRIRAAVCTHEYLAEMTRKHNDANILCLGSRVVGEELAMAIVLKFLATPFDGGRHAERVHQLDNRENA